MISTSGMIMAQNEGMSIVKAQPEVAGEKLFSLEDLNFGGTNYRNMRPENRYTTWWGDELVRLEVEKVSIINKVKGSERTLFTLEELNSWAGLEGNDAVRSLLYASFPYAKETLVLVFNDKKRMIIDFKEKKLIWSQQRKGSLEWNPKSKADALLRDDNLFLCKADGTEKEIGNHDGSREIVYGQAVHRNEFGIEKGTFWSPDGKKLAFYRMDQSMVTDYPQVDLFEWQSTTPTNTRWLE